jgi:hypothetical protein
MRTDIGLENAQKQAATEAFVQRDASRLVEREFDSAQSRVPDQGVINALIGRVRFNTHENRPMRCDAMRMSCGGEDGGDNPAACPIACQAALTRA